MCIGCRPRVPTVVCLHGGCLTVSHAVGVSLPRVCRPAGRDPPWVLFPEPSQPLGQKGDGNTIVDQSGRRTNIVGACLLSWPLVATKDSLAPLGFILPNRFLLNFFGKLGLSCRPPCYTGEKSEVQRPPAVLEASAAGCLPLLFAP
jgi:hypothetical protein